MIVHIIFGYD